MQDFDKNKKVCRAIALKGLRKCIDNKVFFCMLTFTLPRGSDKDIWQQFDYFVSDVRRKGFSFEYLAVETSELHSVLHVLAFGSFFSKDKYLPMNKLTSFWYALTKAHQLERTSQTYVVSKDGSRIPFDFKSRDCNTDDFALHLAVYVSYKQGDDFVKFDFSDGFRKGGA